MMKKLMLLIFIAAQGVLFAQKNASVASGTEGVISYTEKINLHRRMKERISDERTLAMMPEFTFNKMELYFKNDESLYRAFEDDTEDPPITGGGGMQMRMMRPNTELHINSATELMTEGMDMMGKKYLIVDTLRVLPWKLTTEKKKIAGFDCLKATLNDSVRTGRGDSMRLRSMIAWYADAIALPLGPSQYGALPGAILELDVNEGELTYTATKVDFTKVRDSDLKCPTKGERVTRREFMKIMMEMRREQRVIRRE